ADPGASPAGARVPRAGELAPPGARLGAPRRAVAARPVFPDAARAQARTGNDRPAIPFLTSIGPAECVMTSTLAGQRPSRGPVWSAVVIGLIGLLIFSAGVSKALAPSAWLKAVEGYRLLPDRAVFPVGVAILVLEIVFGAILWVPRWRRWSLPGAVGLLLLF